MFNENLIIQKNGARPSSHACSNPSGVMHPIYTPKGVGQLANPLWRTRIVFTVQRLYKDTS